MSAGKQTGVGGWERLFEFLANRELITDILMRVSCLVVHVDSDCAEHVNFGVALHQGGVRRSTTDIIDDIKVLLISKVPGDVVEAFGHKFLFAVAVNSIECWLLPLYGKKRSVANEQNCEGKVAVELNRAGKADRYVVRRQKKLIKDYNLYLELGGPYYEDVNVRSVCCLNESLEVFIESAKVMLQE
jgi:hypothetical protein